MALQYKPKLLTAALLAGGVMAAGSATGAVDITVNNASGSVAGTVSVIYDYNALDTDDVGGIQFDIDYDPNLVDVSSTANCASGAPATHSGSFCTEPDSDGVAPDTVRIVIADTTPPTDEIMPFSISPLGSVDFDILQPGTHTLTFTNAAAGDVTGATVPISGNDATITGSITGNAGYSSAPAPNSSIDFGGVVVGQTNSLPAAITVSEIGDQQLDVMAASFGGGVDFASSTGAFSIPDGDPPVDVELSCTPTARGNLSDTVNLGNNSVNEPMPQYDLTCAGLSPNVGVAPTTITLNGVVGQPNPSGTFDISNPQDGFTSDANNTMLAESGVPEISISSGLTDGTISVDETDTVTVECDTTNQGMFSETITVSWDDPAAGMGSPAQQDVTVDCDIINELPEYESNPAAGSTLAFGTLDNGTTSAPMGIDIGNSDTDAIPNAQLDITGASITGPDAGAFQLTTDPTGTSIPAGQGPDGTNDAEVTCTPTDGMSTFNATLEIQSNDNDTGAGTASPHTYPLTCSGQPDAGFSGNPPAGSTIDFGVLPQGTSSGIETISVTNNGANDDLTLDCTFTGDPQIVILSPTFPVTIGPGASQGIDSQCNADVPGLFSGTLACTTNDPAAPTVNYDFTCVGAAINVPTLSRWGLIALGLTLLIGGALAVRLRA